MESSIYKILFFVFLFVLVCTKSITDKKYRRNKKYVSNPSSNEVIDFRQPSESSPAKRIIVHIPEKEVFMSTIHPAGSLYEDVTDEREVKECMDNLDTILEKKNIKLITVRSALKLNRRHLEEMAFESINYEIEENSEINKESKEYQEFLKYVNDTYKYEVISKLTNDQLVDVVLTNPIYKLKPSLINTLVETTLVSYNPLGNLIFCRDQQITTAKGVVIGRAIASQRMREHKIMKQVFENLNIKILGSITEEYNKNAYLEGGDFIPARENLAMLGVGLRTTIEAAKYLMENDFLGTQYFAIIYDDEDLDQQRMHLDTYFNILNDDHVIVLDFDQVQNYYPNKKIGRKVYLYDNDADQSIESDKSNIPRNSGKYKLIKIYDKFYDFLEEQNFKMIKVTHQQQIDYLINFLNIGNNEVITVNDDLKDVAKESGISTTYLYFRPILNMYGAMHCITQVSRVD